MSKYDEVSSELDTLGDIEERLYIKADYNNSPLYSLTGTIEVRSVVNGKDRVIFRKTVDLITHAVIQSVADTISPELFKILNDQFYPAYLVNRVITQSAICIEHDHRRMEKSELNEPMLHGNVVADSHFEFPA